ncbi:hypothetical protein [Ekhidna sp. To15]|uniref:hypothetical protein n=1 Tax=Ekhidna sp. To15 TaxID=3395267 RepID=UPI003F525F7F
MNIRIGDIVESDYGKGAIVAITKQWIIHNNSLNNDESNEFALLIGEDEYTVLDIQFSEA